MKDKARGPERRPKPVLVVDDDGGLQAAARVVAAGGRVPKKFARARPMSAGPTLEISQAIAKIAPARRVAFEILEVLAGGKAHSDELLHSSRMAPLSEVDRNLTTALVMGVLRWQIALDSQMQLLLARPDSDLPTQVAIALRLGAFQLLHMDRVPAHAALSESVEMCRAAGFSHTAGMVNAVLRRVVAMGRVPAPIFETTGAFAKRLGHPVWLVERWAKRYGRDAALAICSAGQQEPSSGALFASPPESRMPTMDDGSRLVAEIAAAALPREGKRVWDCCAAPGGKTLILSLRLPHVELLATDVSPRRMAQTEARFGHYKFTGNLRSFVVDATRLDASEGQFDLILCDVPCSGTGTLARNPEIRLRLTPHDLLRHRARQTDLLKAAMARVAPGGRLVYSTCSLEPDECEAVVAGLTIDWRRVPIEELEVGVNLSAMVQDGTLRTLPGVHPCDGFYAIVLERPDRIPQ